jgi:uncharacterized membrane protein
MKSDSKKTFKEIETLNMIICHRIPERTFNVKGIYFPVCSRCTGFYMGAVIFFICALNYFINYSLTILLIAFMGILPMILDGLIQHSGLRESSNKIRFISGFLAGLGAAVITIFFKLRFL